MKTSVKISIVMASAVALLGLIVLGRYIFTEINRLKVGTVPHNIISSATSTSENEGSATSTTAEDEPKEFKSSDNWTSFVLPKGTKLSNPFAFYGTTTAFENNISWRLLDANNNQISAGFTYVSSADIGLPGPFKVLAFFDQIPQTQTGKLQVFEASAKDGAHIHVAEAEVMFPAATQKITVYFSNSQLDPDMLDCSKVYPVERMVLAGDGLSIALHELLRGPLVTEQKAGYQTSLSPYITMPGISFTKSGMELDFAADLEYEVGGSCRVTAIRSQIENTAKKASGEQNVLITIDGRSEDILQP